MLKPGQSWANWDIWSPYPYLVVCETQVAEAKHLIPSSGMFLAFSILPGEKEEREELGVWEGHMATPKLSSVQLFSS